MISMRGGMTTPRPSLVAVASGAVEQLHATEGAGFGYSGVKGLNALLATASTRTAAPVIAWAPGCARARRPPRGAAASLLSESLGAAREAGCTGLVIARADSAFYNHKFIAAARAGGAHFSVTARQNKHLRAVIATIGEDAWVGIRYPNAVWEEAERRWISEAEIARSPTPRSPRKPSTSRPPPA
jgi:hypothetical protein